MFSKAEEKKKNKIKEWGLIKKKSLCTEKGTINKVKTSYGMRENIY